MIAPMPPERCRCCGMEPPAERKNVCQACLDANCLPVLGCKRSDDA